MKVLITGFEAFDKERVNPASKAVLKLKSEIKGAEISRKILPTVFGDSIKVLKKHIEKEEPDIVICVGQAGGRYDISIERVAINIDDAVIKDNKGNQPIDQPIYKDGENAYFSNLPIKSMVKLINVNNIPASVSNTAGTYVCNHIMYGLLYMIDKDYPNMRGGFIHVPYIPEQVLDKRNTPFMTEEMIIKALELAIIAAIKNDKDIKETGGRIF